MKRQAIATEYTTRSGAKLTRGQLFRVRGDRTLYTMRRYVDAGAWKWVEANAAKDGYFRAFYVGRRTQRTSAGLTVSPYQLLPVRRSRKGGRARCH